MLARAAIGLGANAGDVESTMAYALVRLRRLGHVVRVSPRYRSKAWGVTEQPDFLNAVALLDTALAPHALLEGLKKIERTLGRVPTFRWGPRAIDLDLLTYGDLGLDDEDLTIPHARMSQ
ncbi:MAG: 2-amino-4-hydroxy-6-hydroxymethyldihydropteridine diphosphokinase, partial [Candidatus Eremiobacteraeota bacterium]|nr:2-amino-4-hydroxy-6-hydroxymethyldihydropteridine diphosphokinase [Candidatus Eremiobacteraeota bacterium]